MKLPKSMRIRMRVEDSKRRNVGGVLLLGTRSHRDRKNDYSRQSFKQGR
jgi:hypothetical protein